VCPFEGAPGPLNAITDVAGVTVGRPLSSRADGPLIVGKGPVRTGVTAVLPRGRDTLQHPSFAGWFSLNGNGEMTGTTWVEESGFLEGPVLITNTHSVGVVRDAAIAWRIKAGPPDPSGFWWAAAGRGRNLGRLPQRHQRHARETRARVPRPRGGGRRTVTEGSVGGGTGMVCYGFKGGIGTASRRVGQKSGAYIVGVLLQANFGHVGSCAWLRARRQRKSRRVTRATARVPARRKAAR